MHTIFFTLCNLLNVKFILVRKYVRIKSIHDISIRIMKHETIVKTTNELKDISNDGTRVKIV